MALIKCEDCGRDISDRAPACPNCGAPVGIVQQSGPETVSLNGDDFIGTKPLLTLLAVKAIQSLNYRVDSADDASGLVSFTTGMTWGSWSGVSGSIFFEEVGQDTFRPSGSGKQNVRGGQIIALNLFDEANNKVRKVIDEMRRLVGQAQPIGKTSHNGG
jgi:zinc-ribbon domain